MSTATASPVDDGHCVGCGPQSPIGLKMTFARAHDGWVESRTRVPQRFQGWRDVVHGGVVALMLDEAMAYAAAAAGSLGVTAELSMRFRAEVRIADDVLVRARVIWQRRGVLAVEANVQRVDGTVLASADGRFVSRGPVVPGTRLGALCDAGG